jgi:hypothetical protein
MCELEALMQELLELASNNPESLFRLAPNKEGTNWDVLFSKGDVWWMVSADTPNEGINDVLKEALDYFETVTEEVIQAHKDSLMGEGNALLP